MESLTGVDMEHCGVARAHQLCLEDRDCHRSEVPEEAAAEGDRIIEQVTLAGCLNSVKVFREFGNFKVKIQMRGASEVKSLAHDCQLQKSV